MFNIQDYYPRFPDCSCGYGLVSITGIPDARGETSQLPLIALVYWEGPKSNPVRGYAVRRYEFFEDALEGLEMLRNGASEAEVIAYQHGPVLLGSKVSYPTRSQRPMKARRGIRGALAGIKALQPQVIRF